MEPMRKMVQAENIKRLLNEGEPQASTDSSRLSMSYGHRVAEELTKLFAGNPSRPSENEFRLMVAAWTQVLQDVVPEYRLAEAFVHARRNRNSTFAIDVSEICAAWQQIREAERNALPRLGQYDFRGTNVCPTCNGTGTKLVVKRDNTLGRDYTFATHCSH